jgi:hypothetical protein
MSVATQSLTGFDHTNRSQAESDEIRKKSRQHGMIYSPVMDVECAADDCDRIFVQRLPDQEFCLRHRTRDA